MKKVLIFVSILLIWFHVDIFFCKKCSSTLMWWITVIYEPKLNYVNLIFPILLIIYLTLLLTKRKTLLLNITKYIIYGLSFINVALWLYMAMMMKCCYFSFVTSIGMHVMLITFLYKSRIRRV